MEVQLELAGQIAVQVRRAGMTHAHLARLAGTSRPRVTSILNGNLDGVSTEMLLRARVRAADDSGTIHVSRNEWYAMRFKGTIVEWNDARGFGFIQPAEGGNRVFCHVSAFQERSSRPTVKQTVTYELARDDRGRPQARQIRYPGSERRAAAKAAPSRPHTGRTIVGAGAFLLVVTGLVVAGRLPWTVLAWYVGASGVTFLLYGWDKTAAEGGHRRTPEQTLNALALAGGWPGAWIAQQAFRHKSRKVSFQVAFWTAVVLNLAALTWLVLAGRDLLISA